MGNPLPQDLRYVDPALTDVAVANMNSMPTIWRDLYPIVPVQKSRGVYAIINKEQFMRIKAQKRAPGAPPKRADFTVSSATFEWEEIELSADITEEDIEEQQAPFNIREDKTLFTSTDVNHALERDAAAEVFKAGVWKKEDATPTGGKWTSGNTPVKDILGYRRDFVLENSLPINCIVLGSLVYQRLQNNSDIVGTIGANRDQIVDIPLLMRLFGLDNVPNAKILVPELVQNTTIESKTDTHVGGFVWNEDAVWMGYRSLTKPSRDQPSALAAFERYAAVTRDWKNDENRVETVQTYSKYDFAVIEKDLGIYIVDAVD